MATSNNSSDDDWLSKDEDQLLEELQSKSKTVQGSEVITQPKAAGYKAQPASSYSPKNKKIIPTAKLKNLCTLDALDLFLYVNTQEHPFNVFLANQITRNDAKERVRVYTKLLANICELELRGFQREFLEFFAKEFELLHTIQFYIETFFSKRSTQCQDEQEIEEFIEDIQRLLLQAHQAHVLDAKGHEVLKALRELLSTHTNKPIMKKDSCMEFLKQLNLIHQNESSEQSQITEQKIVLPEIYPTLDELRTSQPANTLNRFKPKSIFTSTAEYLQHQMLVLREDFMISLRAFIQDVQANPDLTSISNQRKLWRDVRIEYNTAVNAKRHEMLFVRINKEKSYPDLTTLKVGALLCLTTSAELDNLVLATVNYTPLNLLARGYVGIEVVRQFNIGNIYDKNMLMLESPAFFEPYHNVYNYLSNCNIKDFPMKNYIVFGDTSTKPPAYLPAEVYSKCYEQEKRSLVLDEAQRVAYKHALSNDFSIIQGPPGTGKTHLSVQLVNTLIENVVKTLTKTPIVVVTYTNDSLDKFLLKLSECTKDASIVRFGSQTTLPEIAQYNVPAHCEVGTVVNPALKKLYYTVNKEWSEKIALLQKLNTEFDGSEENYQLILRAHTAVRNTQRKLNTIRVMFQYYVAREKSIIAMTTTYAAKMNYLFRFLKSPIVLFEEAAEILESHVLACLTPYTQHVVMIGDHMQLQPYTSSFEHSRSCELNVSLFERFIRLGMPHAVLTLQYRMRPVIAELLWPHIYERLHNADIVQSYPAVKGMHKSLYFLHHEHKENETVNDECSKYNTIEFELICALLVCLWREGGYRSPKNVVILSPYAKQVEIFQEELNKSKMRCLKACTVDSFQGLEADIILLSLVRNNDKNEIGFLKDKHRICVALSRAKYGLYIAGNIKLLARNSKTWNDIYSKLKAADAVGPSFPYVNTYYSSIQV